MPGQARPEQGQAGVLPIDVHHPDDALPPIPLVPVDYYLLTGDEFGTRLADGGPTSWKADIDCTGCSDPRWAGDAWREFYLEFADFQLAYRGQNDGGLGNAAGTPVNPSGCRCCQYLAIPAASAGASTVAVITSSLALAMIPRSKERRVGKECRSRW